MRKTWTCASNRRHNSNLFIPLRTHKDVGTLADWRRNVGQSAIVKIWVWGTHAGRDDCQHGVESKQKIAWADQNTKRRRRIAQDKARVLKTLGRSWLPRTQNERRVESSNLEIKSRDRKSSQANRIWS